MTCSVLLMKHKKNDRGELIESGSELLASVGFAYELVIWLYSIGGITITRLVEEDNSDQGGEYEIINPAFYDQLSAMLDALIRDQADPPSIVMHRNIQDLRKMVELIRMVELICIAREFNNDCICLSLSY